MYNKIKDLLKTESFFTLVEYDDEVHYLRAEAKSAFPPTGVDDVEFLIKDSDHLITYRLNSRELVKIGGEVIGDGGSNRNRLQSIRTRLKLSEMNFDDETERYIREIKQRNVFQMLQKASEPNEVNFLD